MLTILTSFVIPVILVLLFRWLNEPHKPPILGVYQQPNKYYWCKFVYMYIVLSVRQIIIYYLNLRSLQSGPCPIETTHISKKDVELEKKFHVGDHPMVKYLLYIAMAVDGVYFNGMSKKGAAVVCGIARRPNMKCDAFLYVKVEGEEMLLTPSLPDTYLKQSETENGDYNVQGISVTNFIPMRTWKIIYKGDMKRQSDSEKTCKVQLNLTWSAQWSPYNYDTQMSPLNMADSLARETWSRDYFLLLRRLHQTHYEQMGFIEGTVNINGKEHALKMPCVRDHSFGKHRDWRNFHRYVYHFVFLENGDCFAVGSVSEPAILSHLNIGYYCRKADQAVLPVHFSDFQLYQHGENQILPTDYAFTFKAGGDSFIVRVQVHEESSFYIGEGREAKFYERWCSVKVNDANGWACVEWQYNNLRDTGRC